MVKRASRCGCSRSPSKRTAIRVSVQTTYPHRMRRNREPAFYDSPIEFTASRVSTRQPCRRQSRTQAEGLVLAIARKIRATRQCAQRLQISRAPASRFASTPPLTDKKHSASSSFNADLSTHAPATSSPTPTRFIVETPTAKANRGERILPRNAPGARAHTLPRPDMPI